MEAKRKAKKRAVPSERESSDNESSSGSDISESSGDEEIQNEQNINVEFEAQTPIDSDFHGIKQLLLRVFILLQVDVSELTDLIISQSTVGSTMKIVDDDEDEIYGIVSILSLKKYQDKNCMKELQKELLCKSQSHSNELHNKLERIFTEENVGLVVNERFINIPSQIAVPFHNSLKEEVEEAKSQDSTFNFDYLMLISKTLKPTADTNQEGSSKPQQKTKKKKKKKKKNQANTEEEIEYTNFEDEVFSKASELSFSYDVTKATGLAVGGTWDFGDQPMKSYRTIMLIPTSKWKTILRDIEDMVK